MPVSRLTLTDFRSYASATVEPGPGFVLLFGENGAGKTNLLEAVSMLTPGRGLRGAALSGMARKDGNGAWAVAAKLGEIDIGTGTLPDAPERRQVRVNGAPASVNSLSEWLSVLWLTPAMDRLFTGSAGDRRRFLDRLVLALEPSHAHHASRYEAAMRERNKLLADEGWDEAWLASLELAMAEHGTALAAARERAVAALERHLGEAPEDEFARASIALEGWSGGDLSTALAVNRARDAAAGFGQVQTLLLQPGQLVQRGGQVAAVLGHAGTIADQLFLQGDRLPICRLRLRGALDLFQKGSQVLLHTG